MDRTLISIIAGLGAMFGWGVSDFFANSAADKFGHRRAFFYSQIAGLILMGLVALILVRNMNISLSLLPFIILCSFGYAMAYLLFYKGFEIGSVSVVSSVINIQQLFIIGISYFVFSQTLTKFQVPAIIAILIGITLVSVDFRELKSKTISLVKGVKETVASAILFGVIYWPINEYIVERSDWISSSLYIKLFAILFVLVMSIMQRKNLSIKKTNTNVWMPLVVVGVLEAIAVLSIGFGGAYGDNIIVAPIASGLSIVTISLAMFFLKEKITKIQGTGIAITIAGIILMAF